MRNENDFSAEWRALRARSYGEEGIPVILGIETVGSPPPREGEPELAAAFRALANAASDVEEADPGALLEVLAARELRRLG